MSISREFPPKRLFTHRFISPLTSFMYSRVELDRTYKKELKISLVTILSCLLVLLSLFPKQLSMVKKTAGIETIDLVIEDIPRTEQIHRPPPPARPVVPIPTENEDIPEDLTIEGTEIDFTELPPPPPPPRQSEDEGYQFIAYDSPPEPIGGFASLLKHIVYPDVAKRAGVECQIVVGVLVDAAGNCVKTVILKNTNVDLGFGDAAQQAVRKMKWIPARQRDKPIKVWVSVPVTFQLNR